MKYYCLLLAACALAGAQPACASDEYAQRTAYRAALADLQAGRTQSFRRKQDDLADYVLAPYLEYADRRRHISRQTAEALADFRARFPTLAIHDRLRNARLRHLANRRAVGSFLEAYPEDESSLSAELRCFYARALHGDGQQQRAYEVTRELWLVGKSQDAACDPMFETWRKSEDFTEQDAWRRTQLAIENNQRQLAKYLTRFLSGSRKANSEALQSVHASPARIARTENFQRDDADSRYVVQHGLKRLSRREPERALEVWRTYESQLSWTEEERAIVLRSLWAAQAKEGVFPPAEADLTDGELARLLSLEAVRQANWLQVEYWADRLSLDDRHKPEWQYWLARAIEENHGQSERAALALSSLARTRHYYGFLAAQRLDLPPVLNDRTTQVSAELRSQLADNLNVQRARELFAVGDGVNARREWRKALELAESDDVRRGLGYLAQELGQLRLAISTASTSALHDEVQLRFPIAYLQSFRAASVETGLPLETLLAVTRQESAFDRGARSSANARGLMQLLPSTARVVARRIGQAAPSSALLYQADTNSRLGAHYLAWLSVRFNNQLPLMAAGYNAGEHRVDRWIRDAEGTPMDVWIERIPFSETRNYVKNVLAFRQVYAMRLDQPVGPVLESHERIVLGR